jgi:hypothetical protein
MIKLAKIIKQTLFTTTALLALGVVLASVVSPQSVSAGTKPPIPTGCPGSTQSGKADKAACDAIPAGCPGSTKGDTPTDPSKFDASTCPYQATCGSTSGITDPTYSDSTKPYCSCDSTVKNVAQANDQGCVFGAAIDEGGTTDCTQNKCDLVDKYLNPVFNFVSALVGLVVVFSMLLGAVQYASAGPDPQKVGKAKNRIVKSVVGLVAYIFVYAFIQYFLIPGGIF